MNELPTELLILTAEVMMNLGKTPHQPNPWPTELHRSTCNIYTSQRTIFTWSDTVTGSATKAQQGRKHLIA